MSKTNIIELTREEMKFSSGHFTIFSATQRERLHGHNYRVTAELIVTIDAVGLSFDYRHYRHKICELCDSIDHVFLLPVNSPFLIIEEDQDYIYAIFNGERIPFLKRDVILMPLTNITVEELSHWFLKRLVDENQELMKYHVQGITIKVYSTPGICGSATWVRKI